MSFEYQEGKQGIEEIFEAIVVVNFPKLMTDIKLHIQEIQAGYIPKTKQNKKQHLGVSYLNYGNIKTKSCKRPGDKNTLPTEEQG